ncbi:MAG: beta-lactamase family protein [Clostridiales bacterium]|nr:beta-lactamase family protein [Clostridiales bacterium]
MVVKDREGNPDSRFLPRSTPSQLAIDSQGVMDFLDALEHHAIDIHSLVILRHGKVAAEGYWTPYAPEKPYTLFSASKTFTALGIGFAVQEGRIRMDDRVVSFFGEHLDGDVCEHMKQVTIRHLLTMSVGFDEDPHDFPFEGRTDWIRNFLTAYVPNEPGSRFVYSTHASYMLSAIVQKVTGCTLWDYLKERLFCPLSIRGEWWEESPQHISVGGWGLMLTTEDFARLGQFLLQKGSWEGRQLLDPGWVQEAVSAQVSNAAHPTSNPADAPDFHGGYGYQIWRLRKEDAYMASGGFGQYMMVFPKKDAVVAMTCGTHADHLFESVWNLLYPAFLEEKDDRSQTDEDARKRADADEKILFSRLASCQIPLPQGKAENRAVEERYGDVRYVFGRNRRGFRAMTFCFGGDVPEIFLETEDGDFRVSVGFGRWIEGTTGIRLEDTDTDWNVLYPEVSCAGAWEEDVFVLRMVFDHTPFYDTFRVAFCGPALEICAERNVWHYGEYIDPVLYVFRQEVAGEFRREKRK